MQVEINLAPTCLAADMARQNPTYLGEKLKECYLQADGAAVREMLTPVAPEPEARRYFRQPRAQVLPRPKSPTASPPPLLVEGVAGEVGMGEGPSTHG